MKSDLIDDLDDHAEAPGERRAAADCVERRRERGHARASARALARPAAKPRAPAPIAASTSPSASASKAGSTPAPPLHAARVVGERAVLLRRHARREDHVRDALQLRGCVSSSTDHRVEAGERVDRRRGSRAQRVVAQHDQRATAPARIPARAPGALEAERARAGAVRGLLGLDQQVVARPAAPATPAVPAPSRRGGAEREQVLVAWRGRGDARDRPRRAVDHAPRSAPGRGDGGVARSRHAELAVGPRTLRAPSRSGAPISLVRQPPSSQIQVSFTASLRRGT